MLCQVPQKESVQGHYFICFFPFQKSEVTGIQHSLFQQVRTFITGAQKRLFPPPAADIGMVPAEQNLRHLFFVPDRGREYCGYSNRPLK